MAVSLEEFVKDPAVWQRLKKELLDRKEKCCRCGVPLQETITGYHQVTEDSARAAMCSGCYYEALGDLIEAHPIGRPMSSPLNHPGIQSL